jgi:diamine N-acetyltransferase
MSLQTDIVLRPTQLADLDYVVALERHADNVPFIGQWSREEHAAAIARADRQHRIIASAADGGGAGYLIAYNLVAAGFGVYVKRVVVADKSRGIGRAALRAFLPLAFRDLGTDWVWLAVFAENERAQRSYRAVGLSVLTLTPERRRELRAAVGGFSDRSLVMAIRRQEGTI